MPATPDQTANYAISSIYGGAGGARTPLASGDTTLLLQPGDGNAKGFPSSFPFYMQIGQVSIGGVSLGAMEIIKVTNRVNDTLTIVRGNNLPAPDTTTPPLQWGTGTPVVVVNTAGMWANLWSHVTNLNYNAKDFGAKGDGVTDDTTALAAMYSAASGNSIGASCFYPAGWYITSPQPTGLMSHVYHRGDGMGVTIIQLKNGSNGDLFSANVGNINLSGAQGTGPGYTSGCVFDFGFADMTLDGNYANQASGPSYPLRFYGYGYELRSLEARNGYSGGILCDYYGPFPSAGNSSATEATNSHRLESTWVDVHVHTNLGTTTSIGIEMGGPHDSRWTNVLSYINCSHSVHSGPNNGGLQATGCHAWQSGSAPHADANSCSWLQEASMYAEGCEAEGSPNAQLVLLASGVVWNGGSVYAGGAAGYGIQLGQQAAGTNFTNSTKGTNLTSVSSYYINTLIQNITHANGSIWFSQDAGGVLDARILAVSGTNVLYTGTPADKTTLRLNAQGFNDARQQMLRMSGQASFGQSATSPDPGTGGTISTAGVTVARVTPAAAITGVILQAGTEKGQVVYVVNDSTTNSLTFAAAGTSNVADGATSAVAALTGRGFVWDSGAARWFRLA